MTSSVIDASTTFQQAQEKGLIEAAKQGDKLAYRQLYESHVGRVYALCFRLTADKALAEDATQEVFIQLWRKLDNYSGQSKFSTWLHSVTSNVTVSYIRKQKGWWQKVFNIEDAGLHEDADAGSAGDIDLEAYILKLPERARMVFVLHAIEGFRHEEVASMLDMAVGSSKAQFHRAKQLLTEWMSDANENE
ncbi:RNA polymerase sigma factor [Alteromonas sediminis]|uniref:RNA polymerase sigma factor n=1 Tax=Alteromonas sediminis TaxID=2259342 RepID=A0A3N5Y503_9ALTE|nr:RNA polymerase sigma factor [Alteromonas sediminis]RPJ65269.1 RNA polymerase sigma factor [Alteromonas sediminis]